MTWLLALEFTHHGRRVVPFFIGDGSVGIDPVVDDLQGGQGNGFDGLEVRFPEPPCLGRK